MFNVADERGLETYTLLVKSEILLWVRFGPQSYVTRARWEAFQLAGRYRLQKSCEGFLCAPRRHRIPGDRISREFWQQIA